MNSCRCQLKCPLNDVSVMIVAMGLTMSTCIYFGNLLPPKMCVFGEDEDVSVSQFQPTLYCDRYVILVNK